MLPATRNVQRTNEESVERGRKPKKDMTDFFLPQVDEKHAGMHSK